MIPYGKHHIDEEDIKTVIGALKSKNLTQGPLVEIFEKEVSKYVRTGDVERAHSALYNRNALKGFLETEIKHSGK